MFEHLAGRGLGHVLIAVHLCARAFIESAAGAPGMPVERIDADHGRTSVTCAWTVTVIAAGAAALALNSLLEGNGWHDWRMKLQGSRRVMMHARPQTQGPCYGGSMARESPRGAGRAGRAGGELMVGAGGGIGGRVERRPLLSELQYQNLPSLSHAHQTFICHSVMSPGRRRAWQAKAGSRGFG